MELEILFWTKAVLNNSIYVDEIDISIPVNGIDDCILVNGIDD